MLVLRQFTQYAICRFSTQGISFQASIAMICKERSIGLPWFSTKQKLWLNFTLQAGPHPAEIFNWTCFWKFRRELPGCSPPNCAISWQDLSASFRNKWCKRLGSRPKRSIKPCYIMTKINTTISQHVTTVSTVKQIINTETKRQEIMVGK